MQLDFCTAMRRVWRKLVSLGAEPRGAGLEHLGLNAEGAVTTALQPGSSRSPNIHLGNTFIKHQQKKCRCGDADGNPAWY